MEWHPFLAGARLVRLRHMKLDGLLQPLSPSADVASLPFLPGTRYNEIGISGCLRTFTMLWMRGQCIQVQRGTCNARTYTCDRRSGTHTDRQIPRQSCQFYGAATRRYRHKRSCTPLRYLARLYR